MYAPIYNNKCVIVYIYIQVCNIQNKPLNVKKNMYSTSPPRSSYITQLKDLFLLHHEKKPFIETLVSASWIEIPSSRHEKRSYFQMSI